MPDNGTQSEQPTALGVYLHWPFCERKCPYCDFNSHVREAIDQAAWRRAYLAEIAHYGRLLAGRRLGSIFFGGGTPSLMASETVAAVIDALRETWPFVDDIEITLEANPSSSEAGRFRAYRAAGVNRVSIGVQSFDDAALAFLGRAHDAAAATRTVEAAHGIFPRVSFDLIYARPGQTPRAWQDELTQALALAGEHLSLYQLTIEPGTPFHGDWRQGKLMPPGDEVQEALYALTQSRLDAAGLPAYEISNHARPGAESRHNLIYWRGGDYLGIGPGAHGRYTLAGRRRASVDFRRPERWRETVARGGHGIEREEALSPEVAARELLMMGLRLEEGIRLSRFGAGGIAALDTVSDPERRAFLIEEGFLDERDGSLRATERGRAVLNALLAQILL